MLKLYGWGGRQSGKTWEREEYDQICLSLKLVLNNEKKNSKRKHNIRNKYMHNIRETENTIKFNENISRRQGTKEQREKIQ